MDFSEFPVNAVTLTEGQGHPIPHHFKGLPTEYFLANFHNSTVNTIIVYEMLSMLKFVTDGQTDGQTDAGGSLQKTHFTHMGKK